MNPSKIAIMGTGYVGLVVGACFAEHGREVTCIDLDESKIKKLKAGEVPFYEPGLTTLINRNGQNGRLTFTTDAETAIQQNDIIMLAVGTPPKGDGATDLAQVLGAAETIGKNLRGESLVITKSTVPVGTTLRMKEVIQNVTDQKVHVAFNPEFLREGNAVQDFMHPNRTVVGCEEEEVEEILRDLYRPFISPHSPLVITDIHSAEMAKYAANGLLATKISFMNDIANICSRLGADVEAVKRCIGLDERIGEHFLNPGIGFGGSCFPKDIKSLIYTGQEMQEEMPILRSVMKVNERMRYGFVDQIKKHFGDLNGLTFGVWGLAFKPNTDDMREAPAITIIEELLVNGAKIKAYDPEAMETASVDLGDRIEYHQNAYSAINQCDAVLVLTEWNEFRSPDWERVSRLLKNAVIFDGRNIYEPSVMAKRGFHYYSVGRPAVKPA